MTKKSSVLEVADVPGLQEVIEKIKNSNKAWAKKNNRKWGLEGLTPVWNNCARTTIHLDIGIKNLINSDESFKEYIRSGKKTMLTCLDLGAGMCQLGPIMAHLGFKTYVALDLYELRNHNLKGVRYSLDCAKQMFIDLESDGGHFIVQGDVKHARKCIESSVNGFDENCRFDLVVSTGTEYNKGGEGIPDWLFEKVKEDLLHPEGIAIRFDSYKKIDYENS